MAVKKRLQAATIRAGLLLIVLTHNFDAKCVEGATVNNGGIEQQASQLLSKIGVQRGIVVLLAPAPAELAVSLARQSELIVYAQVATQDASQAARRHVAAADLLGTRVYVEQGSRSHIHLANNLADAVIVTADAADDIEQELLRVVRPLGKLIVGDVVKTKPYPEGADDWTHPYHGPDNNPQSEDRVARYPYLTQFLAEPYYVPFPEVTVTSTGRVFKAFGHIGFKRREWPWINTLVALNGYNGTLLWKRELEPGYIIHRNTMIATPETLYMGDASSCKLIDAASGELIDEILAPPDAAGPAWKWMAIEEGVLYAMLGEEEPYVKVHRGVREEPGWPWGPWDGFRIEDYQTGLGRTLCAYDLGTKEWLWLHHETNPIDGRAICMKDGRIFFLSHPQYLACVDGESGDLLWKNSDENLFAAIGQLDKAQGPGRGFFTSAYMKCSDQCIYFAGPQITHLVAASTEDGSLLWQHEPSGNFQLVLREEGLYAMGGTESSKKFDPLTGEILADFGFLRRSCTRATGSIDTVFCRYRPSGTVRLSVADDRMQRFALMRPACHDGVLIAGGQLYWGPWMCDCNLQLVGFVSMSPAGDFEFNRSASEAERLVVEHDQSSADTKSGDDRAAGISSPLALHSRPGDWPAYRGDNQRSNSSPATVPADIQVAWQRKLPPDVVPTAPITAGGLVFHSGSDGIVRALDANDGTVRWQLYTGGSILFPPAVEEGRLLVGSGDGWICAADAETGRQLWRFRAAPAERKISVHGRLMSTWPVGSGVLADRGVVYAAAGITSQDGTHIYALDIESGKIRWQNNTSGHLGESDSTNGVSVQGHLLLYKEQLYLAGGNMVSPAVYDLKNGRCLSTLDDEGSIEAPRGRELFLVAEEVRVFDKLLYGERDYMRQGKVGPVFLQADSGDVLIRGFGGRLVRIDRGAELDNEVEAIWESKYFAQISSLALGKNAVVVAGRLSSVADDPPASYSVAALSLENGEALWTEPLPARPVPSAVALDADGQIHVATGNGDVVCLTAEFGQSK